MRQSFRKGSTSDGMRSGGFHGNRVGLQSKSVTAEPLQPDAGSISIRSDGLQSALITIGILCFNARDTILRALRSALAQDWPSIEVIIVDDCSTDGSVEIVAHAIADEPRARLVRHCRNTGAGGARKTVVDEAHGTFIAFFDDDDDSVPDRLRSQFERLTAYERERGRGSFFATQTVLWSSLVRAGPITWQSASATGHASRTAWQSLTTFSVFHQTRDLAGVCLAVAR